MKFEQLIKIVENNQFNFKDVIGYHGSESDSLELDPSRAVWFALDSNSEILNHYSSRGGNRNIFSAELNLGNCLDLSMYDTDDMIDFHESRQFLIDCELEDKEIKQLLFITWDNRNTHTIMLTNILNNVIKFSDLSKKYDSLIIKENESDTVCILNNKNIKKIDKL